MKPGVIIVGNFLSAKGKSRGVCEDLAERLGGWGWQVSKTAFSRSRLSRFAEMTIDVFRWRDRYDVAQMDVFSGPSFIWAEWISILLRRLGKPTVLTLHGGNLPAFALRHRGRVDRLLKRSAYVTCPSGYLKAELDFMGQDIHILPNGLELGRYTFRERNSPRGRLIWLRAFHEIYNPGMAARTLARLAQSMPEAELLMIGPDKGDGSRDRFEGLVAGKEICKKVRVMGQVSKAAVPEALCRGDVFLNTSRVDNMPVSVMEAMACGLCVVSTDVGGMRYLVREGENGLLVKDDSDEEMADAVSRIVSEAGLGGQLSAAARRSAEDWDWTGIVERWDAILRKAGGLTSA